MGRDFTTVSELADEHVPVEQVGRLAHRYFWAASRCAGKDVLEVACGAGQGLGYLLSHANSVRAGDITPSLVAAARAHYGDRLLIDEMDAEQLPFADESLDVVMLFEAIYYLPDAARFVSECRRVLRAGGQVLIATANKDLYDFSPSPFSHRYYGVVELRDLFASHGFSCEFFGNVPVDSVSWRQRVLRPVKKLVVRLGLMPRTMAGKRLMKRLVFGKMVPMPAEIDEATASYLPPVSLAASQPNCRFKAIYAAATLQA